MKNYFKQSFIIALIFFTYVKMIGQGNPQWSLPPNYWNPVPGSTFSSLPTQSSPGYTGWVTNGDQQGVPVQGPSNMYYGPNGTPLFSVIAGFVFSPQGYLIDTLIDTISVTRSGYSYTKTRQVATGWGDVCIVPMPGSCSKYYIFSAVDYGSVAASSPYHFYEGGIGTSSEVAYKPCFAIIDVSQQDPNGPTGEYGKNLSRSTAAKPTVVDLYTATTPTTTSSNPGHPPLIGPVYYACTRLIAGSYRYLYVNVADEIFVYKIDGTSGSNGMSFVQTVDYSSSTIFNSEDWDPYVNTTLSEMEVYVDSAAGKIKLATTMISNSTGQNLIFSDYSFSTGQYVSSSTQTKCFGNCDSGERITGVEFSPNGKWVYITRLTTSDTCGLYAVLYSNPATTYNFYKAGTKTSEFSWSQIELGTDSVMYFIGSGATGRIAKITSPSGPNRTNLTDNFRTINFYSLTSPEFWNWNSTVSGASTGSGVFDICYLPDQIDKEIYGTPQFTAPACCEIYSSYSKITYTATTAFSGNAKQTWQPNTSTTQYNPLLPAGNTSSIATIEQELRIPMGYTVTIRNMTIKFSPNGTLVVQGSDGVSNSAQLILRNCTLDVDSRCGSGLMWPGVRVWGNTSFTRSNTSQGYINIDSSCVITNAWIGIEMGYNSSVDPIYTPFYPISPNLNNSGGGQITCQNSSFINNQRDIYFQDYTGGTSGLASIFKNTFVTNAYLNAGSGTPPLYHIQINNFKPNVNTQGNNFSCSTSLTATNYAYGCYGIYCINSTLSVDQFTTGSIIRSKFSNLAYGVYATSNNTNVVSVKNSSFRDNFIGAFYGTLTNPIFQSDSVFVRNPGSTCSIACGPNFAGLFLEGSTGYKVQSNYFTQFNAGVKNPFGIVASNSGAHVNCIFKNTFKSLYKGSQAQYRNFVSAAPPAAHNYVGLIYLCNSFVFPISAADIYVPATASSSNWGTSYTDTSAIQFNQGSQSATYPSVGGNTFSKTTGGSDYWIETTGKVIGSNYIYYCAAGSCTGASVRPDNNNSAYVTLSAYSVSDVNCSTDPYSNGLRISNPVAFMLGKAFDLKTTRDSIYNELGTLSTADSAEKRQLANMLANTVSSRHRLIDEAIHLLIECENRDSAQIVINALMKEKAMELDSRTQLETGILIQDIQMATNAVNLVSAHEGETNYVKLHRILLNHLGQTPEQILSDPGTLTTVQAMQNDSSDRTAYIKAKLLLQAAGHGDYSPYFVESSSRVSNETKPTGSNAILENGLSAKPNPFKGSTTLSATVSEKTNNSYILITDILGSEVAKYPVQQGENQVNFVAPDNGQQMFFCTLVVNGARIKTNKMVLIK
jgi:hypothetical protein